METLQFPGNFPVTFWQVETLQTLLALKLPMPSQRVLRKQASMRRASQRRQSLQCTTAIEMKREAPLTAQWAQSTTTFAIAQPEEQKLAVFDREEEEKDLPLYITRLVAGYEYRVFWYELFECFRKVLLLLITDYLLLTTGTSCSSGA